MTVDGGWIPRKHYKDHLDLLLDKDAREGVYVQAEKGPGGRHRISGIIWRPGDPNALAEMIIRRCTRPLTLELDGRKYRIEPG